MTAKFLIPLALFALTLGLTNCSKEKEPKSKDCDTKPAACNDTIPNEACAAYFERWFYNKDTKQCEQIGYSGCSFKGLATKEECEACKCE